MTGALRTLGFFVARHARAVVAVWLVLLVLAGVGALTLSRGFTASYTVPGASFENVRQQLQEKIPENGVSSGYVVLESETGFSDQQKEAVAAAVQRTGEIQGVAGVLDPFVVADQIAATRADLDTARAELESSRSRIEEGKAAADAARAALPAGLSEEQVAQLAPDLIAQETQLAEAQNTLKQKESQLSAGEREFKAAGDMHLVSADETTALVVPSFTKDTNSLTPAERQEIFAVFDELKSKGIEVNYSYELAQDVSGVVGASEIIGLTVAFLVLLVALGTVVAAGLPLLLAVIGAAVGVALVYTSTAFIGMTATDPVLALMLGLGVGIDYALLIVHRFRKEHAAGKTVAESVAEANSTAGHSVFFAGATNIIALAALSLTGLPFLTVMGLAAAFAVALVTVSSLTLVPAALTLLGSNVLTKKQREGQQQSKVKKEEKRPRNRKEALAQREVARGGWGSFVTRYPGTMIVLSLVLLAISIVPTSSLRLGLPDGSYQSADSTAYASYQTISDEFGEGTNGPIIASVTLAVPGDQSRLRDVTLDVADRLKTNHVERITILSTSADNSTAVLAFFPSEGPSAESTLNTVKSMQQKMDAVQKATATRIGLTGQTVANIEISERIAGFVPLYLGVVISLCLILMAFVFRSILVPVMATVGFLLSTLASFGAVVAVYQWGWLGDLLGVTQPGPILAFLPILLIGILFGLSVDYQIFIVSGMRDAHRAGHPARDAVLLGYRQGGVVVTACGIIMVAVFAGFIFSHLTVVRPIGFALALGVAMDAFLIRTTFIPASMYLLGEAAWWWPFGKRRQEQEEHGRHIAQ
ncbi:MAG: MMPL family transporter [Rothia sp. (in: high G+C Gram-positive bacteria)]|nr:MMPL family transporter [Rothia sp. (in: high G+C Gram-positive bacteria)]